MFLAVARFLLGGRAEWQALPCGFCRGGSSCCALSACGHGQRPRQIAAKSRGIKRMFVPASAADAAAGNTSVHCYVRA